MPVQEKKLGAMVVQIGVNVSLGPDGLLVSIIENVNDTRRPMKIFEPDEMLI